MRQKHTWIGWFNASTPRGPQTLEPFGPVLVLWTIRNILYHNIQTIRNILYHNLKSQIPMPSQSICTRRRFHMSPKPFIMRALYYAVIVMRALYYTVILEIINYPKSIPSAGSCSRASRAATISLSLWLARGSRDTWDWAVGFRD